MRYLGSIERRCEDHGRLPSNNEIQIEDVSSDVDLRGDSPNRSNSP